MSLSAPTSLDELKDRIALYRTGSIVPGFLLFVVWLGALVILSTYEVAIFGNDETLTVRFMGSALFTVATIMWPLIPIKAYVRWRSRKLGLVCRYCNDVLMYNPKLSCRLRDVQNCPTCGRYLFSNVQNEV